MPPPLGYDRSCVPLALAAIMDVPVERSAALLWDAGAARRLGGAPGGLGWGTDPDEAGDLAVRLGWGVQSWCGSGRMFFSAAEYRTYLAERAHVLSRTVSRPRPAAARDREPEDAELIQHLPGRDPDPDPSARLLTLREWRSKFPSGLWLIAVLTAPGSSHALAVRDGEVLTGAGALGADFDQHRVVLGLRLLPPTTRTTT